jgi:uncharacterized OB-fold protein
MNALLQDKSGRLVKELLFSGAFERDGSHPMCPSGGALGVGNPIAATGLMKIAELYFQLSGQAGKRQVEKNAHRGVAQAWGDLMQVGTVVVMGSEGAAPTFESKWAGKKQGDLPGTPLKEITDVPYVADNPDLRYSWDNGMALTTYLDGFKQGKIRGSRCRKCGRMMIPARAFCEVCNLKDVVDYYDLPDTGTVRTFTLSRVNWDSSMLPGGKINIFAVIEIDGAGEDMGLCHMLSEVKPKDVKIGMRVKAVWKAAKDREGTVIDCKYFRPLKKGEKATGKPVRIKPVELDSTTAKAFPGAIPLSYRYTLGTGGTKFYGELGKGKISGTYCKSCDAVHVPATSFCEFGMTELDVNKNARVVDARRGIVIGCTAVHEDRSGEPLSKPKVIVQVGFPGVIGSVFGALEGAGAADVEVGMDVKLLKKKGTGPEAVAFNQSRAWNRAGITGARPFETSSRHSSSGHPT